MIKEMIWCDQNSLGIRTSTNIASHRDNVCDNTTIMMMEGGQIEVLDSKIVEIPTSLPQSHPSQSGKATSSKWLALSRSD